MVVTAAVDDDTPINPDVDGIVASDTVVEEFAASETVDGFSTLPTPAQDNVAISAEVDNVTKSWFQVSIAPPIIRR